MTIYTTLETFRSTVFQIMGDREIEVRHSAKRIVILLIIFQDSFWIHTGSYSLRTGGWGGFKAASA